MFVLIGCEDYRPSTFIGVFSSREKAEENQCGGYDSYDIYQCEIDDLDHTDIYAEEWEVEYKKKKEEEAKKREEKQKRDDEEMAKVLRQLEIEIKSIYETDVIQDISDELPTLPTSPHTLDMLQNFTDLRHEILTPNEFSETKISHIIRRILFAAYNIGVNVPDINRCIDRIKTIRHGV